jgi:hypothetical protein
MGKKQESREMGRVALRAYQRLCTEMNFAVENRTNLRTEKTGKRKGIVVAGNV